MFYGMIAVGLSYGLFYYLTNHKQPAAQFKKDHPLLSLMGLVLAMYFIVYLLGSVVVFLLGILLPIIGESQCRSYWHSAFPMHSIWTPSFQLFQDENIWSNHFPIQFSSSQWYHNETQSPSYIQDHCLWLYWIGVPVLTYFGPFDCFLICGAIPTVIFLHASMRLRNLKNKLTNKVESLGLKRTPMGIILEALGLEPSVLM